MGVGVGREGGGTGDDVGETQRVPGSSMSCHVTRGNGNEKPVRTRHTRSVDIPGVVQSYDDVPGVRLGPSKLRGYGREGCETRLEDASSWGPWGRAPSPGWSVGLSNDTLP